MVDCVHPEFLFFGVCSLVLFALWFVLLCTPEMCHIPNGLDQNREAVSISLGSPRRATCALRALGVLRRDPAHGARRRCRAANARRQRLVGIRASLLDK